MILTAHQPVYLPWLGLFHKIALADAFVVFDTVQYLKKDWNNRNMIKTIQGPIWLTVPVLTHNKYEQKLTEVEIDNSVNWRKKHLKSIELNYKKAPYFNRYIDAFREIYEQDWKMLADLNDTMLRSLLQMLGIKVEISYGHDLGLTGYKSDLVLDMCKKVGANIYVFGALGRGYAEVDKFEQAGIEVIFQDYKHPEYLQQFGKFAPYLSVLDLLFNCGGQSCDILMSRNLTKAELQKMICLKASLQ